MMWTAIVNKLTTYNNLAARLVEYAELGIRLIYQLSVAG